MKKIIHKQRKPIRVIYVSSYIPRKCGIATYTKDLTNDINQLNPYALAEIMAINRPEEDLCYPWEVKFRINYKDLNSYIQAAEYANQSEADLVVLEHEFGLYGGKGGDYILNFAETLKKPLAITFHTIITDVNNDFGLVQKRLVEYPQAIFVMMKQSSKKLAELYPSSKNKIAVVPHGTPDLPFGATEFYKKRKRLSDRIVMGNINLISENKGIEFGLEAVAQIAKKFPNILYLIVGQTHPVVLQNEGEKYRNFLKETIKKLKIEDNVKFVNEYLSLEDLLEWLQAMDFYITPYLNPEQSSSGALAYAVGAGKACISTPYLYAKEVLGNNQGVLVPFKDSKAIAETVIDLIENPSKKRKIENTAYEYGRLMTWSNVALQHLDIFENILDK